MSSIVRLDSLQAIYGGGHIYSVKAAEDVQNGFVGVAGNLVAGEREVRNFDKPGDPAVNKAVLVAQDEIVYDESSMAKQNLKNFVIEAGKVFRAYDLAPGDVFSVSTDAITALAADVVVGNNVILAADSYKLAESDAAGTAGKKFIGRIEAIENIGTTTVTGAPGLIAGGVSELAVIRVVAN